MGGLGHEAALGAFGSRFVWLWYKVRLLTTFTLLPSVALAETVTIWRMSRSSHFAQVALVE